MQLVWERTKQCKRTLLPWDSFIPPDPNRSPWLVPANRSWSLPCHVAPDAKPDLCAPRHQCSGSARASLSFPRYPCSFLTLCLLLLFSYLENPSSSLHRPAPSRASLAPPLTRRIPWLLQPLLTPDIRCTLSTSSSPIPSLSPPVLSSEARSV